ncbi:MAG TPA: Nif3-like dinuclear metal center hexameric protein [Candidatus Blautia faecipullorum]|nr:Nif3-like dinuclear metal center hexameric protein [Candidatus Blautia faecipullorum]
MKVNELTAWLENQYPGRMAEDWDNVGLLVGDDSAEVSHVFLALDLTEQTLEEALEAGADMVITHHPMIFHGMKKINNHDFTGRKVLTLIRRGIQYYAMHTNYDILGMAELSADYLKLKDRQVLTVTEETGSGQEGLGRVGVLPRRMTLRECGEFVKDAFALPDVRIYGDPDMPVEKAAVCTGSGKSLLGDVFAKGAQVYITGDVDYHTGIDAVAQGLAIIDAGHYGTEYIFMDAMKKTLSARYPELKISCAKIRAPYTVLCQE